MGLTKNCAVLGLLVGMGLLGAGCEKSRDEMRPDMDTVVSRAHGLQSRDLREMTDRMAPDLLQIPEIVQNPNRITVVVKGVKNGLEGEGSRNLDIFVKRLAGLLNSTNARDRIAFVEENATLQRFQSEELGNRDPFGEAGRPGAPADPKIQPQFFLYGEFESMRDGKTVYYLCQFKLTNAVTGQIVWQNQYETRTLK